MTERVCAFRLAAALLLAVQSREAMAQPAGTLINRQLGGRYDRYFGDRRLHSTGALFREVDPPRRRGLVELGD